MDYKNFKRIVSDEVRGDASSDVSAMLRRPENLRKWADALVDILSGLAEQLSRKNAEELLFKQECLNDGYDGKQAFFSFKAENQQWRVSVNAAKRHIERRLREVKRLIQEQEKTKFDQNESLWRLVEKAEKLVPFNNKWHDELKAIRDACQKSKDENSTHFLGRPQ